MRVQHLIEYVQVDPAKLKPRLQQDGGDFATTTKLKYKFGSEPENFAKWLEQFDPSSKKKYVNWMIQRYIQGGISKLEDFGSGIKQALGRFDELKNAKKLGADADINKIKGLPGLNDLIRQHETTRLGTKAEKIKDVDIILNSANYSIVTPKTYEASKDLACNTEWCTAFPDMYKSYSKQGPLYVITDKKTNERWQFHFESESFMDERDNPIEQADQTNDADDPATAALVSFFEKHKEVADAFAKIGKVEVEGDSWIFSKGDGYNAYDNLGNYHRDPSKGPAIKRKREKDQHGESNVESYYVHGERHREDGPAFIRTQGDLSIEHYYQNGKQHRDPKEGPAIISYLDLDTGEIDPSMLDTRDPEEALKRYQRRYDYWVNGKNIGSNKTGGPLPEKKEGLPSQWYDEDFGLMRGESKEGDDELAEMMRLAGVSPHQLEMRNTIENKSKSAAEKATFQAENKVQPGTDEWFRLWFARPDLTGETPFDK